MAVRKKYSALGRGLDELTGKGLDALISTEEVHTNGSSSIHEIELEKIIANPNQPRHEFDAVALQELANSIAEIGIIQPITLRQMNNGLYQIIAGERRFRASLLAGIQKIPAYIRTVDDENMMEMALIENIQREDLNALEIALAYQNLLEQYKLTQEQLSARVGKKRATITNYLRLLHLPAAIQMALQNKEIDMGHARALLAISNPKKIMSLFHEIVKNGYSVRKVEELVKQLNEAGNDTEGKEVKQKSIKLPKEYHALREHLSEVFSTKVQMSFSSKGKGKIVLPFSSEEELEKIIGQLDQIKKNNFL